MTDSYTFNSKHQTEAVPENCNSRFSNIDGNKEECTDCSFNVICVYYFNFITGRSAVPPKQIKRLKLGHKDLAEAATAASASDC